MLATQSPFPQYFDKDGTPLDNGSLYFGQVNQNPETAPITVYWDAAGTQPAAQPIRTLNGYTYRNGAPAQVYAASDYSLSVRNRRGQLILYAANSAEYSLASAIDTLRSDLASTSSAAKGAGLSGFNGQLNYAASTIGWALNGLEVDPRWFGFKGDWNGTTGTDDTAALQSAINWIPSNGTGAIKLPRNSNCLITAKLVIGSRNLVIDGCQSTITLTADIGTDYLFDLSGTNCEFRNLSINKKTGVTAAGAIKATGLQHVFRNITSRDQKWTTFFYGVDLKESHFHDIRVDLDVSGKTGDIFKLDYCVNNTWNSCFLGFAAQAFYLTGATSGSGYACEGISLSNVIAVYCGKGVTGDRATALTIGSGCIFDFCETWGVFCTNGNDLKVIGAWIAGNTTNGFICVGTGASFVDAHVLGGTLTRGATAITGTVGVSLPGPRAKVIGVSFEGGMNGGTVSDPTSRCFGNSVAAPGTAILMPNGNAGPGDSGQWTPGINFGGGSVGITFNTLAAIYTIVGNEVIARARITLSSKGSSTGAFQISGLPFSNNGSQYGSALVTRQLNMATPASPVGQVQLASASAVFFSNSAPGTLIDNTAFNNNSTFDVELRYQIA